MLKLNVSEKGPNTILVRGVNWIGDAVMTMPALRALKLSEPDSRLVLLVKPWVAPLFEKDPNVDEIILYSADYRGVAGRLKLARRLREYHFSRAVLFQNAFDAALIAFLAGIPERIGYSRDARRFLLTRTVPFDARAKVFHHVDYYLNLLDKAGFNPKKSKPWIYLSNEERLQARKRLEGLKRPVTAMNPGATYGSSKRWLPERFAEVAQGIIGGMKGSVVVFGGPKETAIADEIIRGIDPSLATGESLMNMAGRTSLRELSALISECDLLLTNDSGPMHIGYAAGTPVVAVFGSTSPELTGPVGGGNEVIRKNLDCAPCFDRECGKGGLKCMDLISSDEVVESVRRLLPTRRAVFFDRDGTLCRDAGYLSRMEDFEVFPETGSLKRLKEEGFLLIGVTNQSGIARGLVDEDFVRQINHSFIDAHGFDGFYYCPHHPDEHCSCRKPEPGLLLDARRDFGIDLRRSFVIGDKDVDMLLARAAGATGIHVRTGQEMQAENADLTARDLNEAVDIILKQGEKAHA